MVLPRGWVIVGTLRSLSWSHFGSAAALPRSQPVPNPWHCRGRDVGAWQGCAGNVPRVTRGGTGGVLLVLPVPCCHPPGAGCSRARTSCEFQSFSAPWGSDTSPALPWWPLRVPSPEDPKPLLVLQRLVSDTPFLLPFLLKVGVFSGGGGFSVWDFQMFRCPDVAFEAAALPCPPPLPPWERDLGPTSLVQNFLHSSIPAPARFLGHSQRSGRLCPGVVGICPLNPKLCGS